jgi:cell division protein FtsI (penicillin-binding protein 3)
MKRAATTNERIAGAFLLALVGLLILWGRCAWLHVGGAQRYGRMSAAQHRVTERLIARRGTLYDQAGRALALTVPAPSVYAEAMAVGEKRRVAQRLAGMVGREAKAIQRRLEREKRFVWIARQLSPEVVPAVLTMRGQGIGMVEEPARLYPHGALAAHVLGFVNIDHRGLEGMELALDGALRGQQGWRSTIRDAKGQRLIGPWTVSAEPLEGLDVVLTLDGVVQQVAEETLAWGMRTFHAKGGVIIVMEPATGAIRAMANAQAYDPNEPAHASPDARRNRAVTDVFEPGSVFKIVAAAALLDAGRITPEERIFCEDGAYPTVGRHILHDHRPHGWLSFHDVVMLSSNIGVAKASQRLSPDELYGAVTAFGFGRKTGIEVPGEVSGMIKPPSAWSRLSPFIIPMGQEVAVTPLQLAVMTAVVANGGVRVRPSLVERIQTGDGRVVRERVTVPSDSVRVISPQTAAILQEMLSDVVASGTGQSAKIQSLTVAGKTGTAQKLEPDGRRYSHSRFVASFVGFGPVPDPRFVIVVCMDEPRPIYYGGVVAAPMFKRVVERLSSYWKLERLQLASAMP